MPIWEQLEDKTEIVSSSALPTALLLKIETMICYLYHDTQFLKPMT